MVFVPDLHMGNEQNLPQDIILFYDSECAFCSRSLHFVLARDKKHRFKVASLQSHSLQQLLKKLDVKSFPDSIVVYTRGHLYFKWKAVQLIFQNLNPFFRFLAFGMRVIPRSMGDKIYDFMARNRNRFDLIKKSCYTDEIIRSRWIED